MSISITGLVYAGNPEFAVSAFHWNMSSSSFRKFNIKASSYEKQQATELLMELEEALCKIAQLDNDAAYAISEEVACIAVLAVHCAKYPTAILSIHE